MNMDREFSTIEKESNKKSRKQQYTSDADYQRTRFEK
jgi:hypothetical protein